MISNELIKLYISALFGVKPLYFIHELYLSKAPIAGTGGVEGIILSAPLIRPVIKTPGRIGFSVACDSIIMDNFNDFAHNQENNFNSDVINMELWVLPDKTSCFCQNYLINRLTPFKNFTN